MPSDMTENQRVSHRYLTKTCDQIVSLISSEHAGSILWSDEDNEDGDMDEHEYDESDRMFTFEVAQTNEQEESVSVHKGFKVSLSWYCAMMLLLTKLASATQC